MPDTFPKLSEMVCSLSDISEESHSLPTKHEQQCSANYLCENLCLGNFSSGGQIPGQQPSAADLYSNSHNPTSFGGVPGSSRYNFSHVFPFFSPSDLSTSLASNSLGLNLQTLDLLTSTNYGGNFSQASHDVIGAPKGSTSLSPDHMHMQDLADSPSNSSNKVGIFFFFFPSHRYGVFASVRKIIINIDHCNYNCRKIKAIENKQRARGLDPRGI